MELPKEFESKKINLYDLCIRYNVLRLFIFGSLTRGNFDIQRSDIDIIAEFDEINPVIKGENILRLWNELESLFVRKVDLLTTTKFKNPYLQREIDTTKQLIYDRESF